METIAALGVKQRRARSRACVPLLVGSLLFSAATASAQSEADREQARELAARGFDALQRKDYVAAEEAFRRADALIHAPTLVVDHARALVGLGKLVEGHEGFELVLREGVPSTAPLPWKRALQVAATELAAVRPRLAWLTITVTGAPNPRLEIDDKPVPRAVLGVPRATNPGVRMIRAYAPGFLPTVRSVSLREGQSQTLQLVLDPDPAAVVAAPPDTSTSEPGAPPPSTSPPPPSAPDRTLPTILLGAGGLSLVAGVVTGVIALRTRAELGDSCPNRVCVPADDAEYADYRNKLDRYRGLGTASGVALAMGAGAALSGAALLLFSGKKSENEGATRRTHRAGLSLTLTPSLIQVSGGF